MAVPKYGLYGDRGDRPDWFANVERLDQRCRERGWVIAPHTHPRFMQIVVCTSGAGEMTIEGETQPFSPGSVMIVPPFRIHGFRYLEAADGWVLTVESGYLSDLLVRAPALKAIMEQPGVFDLSESALPEIESKITKLSHELEGTDVSSVLGSEIQLLSILLTFVRQWPIEPNRHGAVTSRKVLADRFIALVEARYRDQPALSEYAAELGVSTSKLRQACQMALGLSPISIVHDRILSEAKRCLAYTGMSVSGIAHYLGFTDAAYFSRFFTRAASKTPTAFRRAHEHASL